MEKRDAMTTSDLVKEMCQNHGISKSNDLSLTTILTHRDNLNRVKCSHLSFQARENEVKCLHSLMIIMN